MTIWDGVVGGAKQIVRKVLRLGPMRPVRMLVREARLASGRQDPYVPIDDLRRYYGMAIDEQGPRVDGPITYFEAGVFAGQSMAVWHSVARAMGRVTRIFGADSFAGLPPSVEGDEGGWRTGDFTCSLPTAKRNLRRLGVPLADVELIEGWFDESLTPELAARVGTVHVAMLDADAYSSTVPVLDFLTGVLDDVCWLIFDDWFTGGNYDPATDRSRGLGVERAFTEWHAAHPEWEVEEIGTYDLTLEWSTFRAGRVIRLERSPTPPTRGGS